MEGCSSFERGFQEILVRTRNVSPPLLLFSYGCQWLIGGCRILTAHGPNESVEKKDLLQAVEGYKKLILRALQ